MSYCKQFVNWLSRILRRNRAASEQQKRSIDLLVSLFTTTQASDKEQPVEQAALELAHEIQALVLSLKAAHEQGGLTTVQVGMIPNRMVDALNWYNSLVAGTPMQARPRISNRIAALRKRLSVCIRNEKQALRDDPLLQVLELDVPSDANLIKLEAEVIEALPRSQREMAASLFDDAAPLPFGDHQRTSRDLDTCLRQLESELQQIKTLRNQIRKCLRLLKTQENLAVAESWFRKPSLGQNVRLPTQHAQRLDQTGLRQFERRIHEARIRARRLDNLQSLLAWLTPTNSRTALTVPVLGLAGSTVKHHGVDTALAGNGLSVSLAGVNLLDLFNFVQPFQILFMVSSFVLLWLVLYAWYRWAASQGRRWLSGSFERNGHTVPRRRERVPDPQKVPWPVSTLAAVSTVAVAMMVVFAFAAKERTHCIIGSKPTDSTWCALLSSAGRPDENPLGSAASPLGTLSPIGTATASGVEQLQSASAQATSNQTVDVSGSSCANYCQLRYAPIRSCGDDSIQHKTYPLQEILDARPSGGLVEAARLGGWRVLACRGGDCLLNLTGFADPTGAESALNEQRVLACIDHCVPQGSVFTARDGQIGMMSSASALAFASNVVDVSSSQRVATEFNPSTEYSPSLTVNVHGTEAADFDRGAGTPMTVEHRLGWVADGTPGRLEMYTHSGSGPSEPNPPPKSVAVDLAPLRRALADLADGTDRQIEVMLHGLARIDDRVAEGNQAIGELGHNTRALVAALEQRGRLEDSMLDTQTANLGCELARRAYGPLSANARRDCANRLAALSSPSPPPD